MIECAAFEGQAAPIDARRYRWIIVAYTLVLQAVVVGTLVYCFALFSVPWLEEFDAPRRDVMLAISLLQIGMGVFSPFVGRAMDRFPMRNLVLLGIGALASGLWFASHATALWHIQLLHATLFPAALALMGVLAAQTLVAKWFDDKRGMAIGLSAMGTNLGGIVFPLAVGAGLVSIGWRDTMQLLVVASLLLVVPLTLLVLRHSPPARDVESAGGGNSAEYRQWRSREILTTRMFWLPMVGMLPINLAYGAVQFNLGAYGQDLGLGGEQIANLIALNAIAMILGKFFFGGLGDRLNHRLLYWVSAGFMALALVILALEPQIWFVVLAVVCMGLSGGGILPLLGVMLGSRFGAASFGRVMGFAMMIITVAALGPILAGWTYDLTGSYTPALQGFLVVLVPAAVAMRWLPTPPITRLD